jgi:hypothetical protein
MNRILRSLALLAFIALASWLGVGAGGFLMIDQGDYVRTVNRMVVAPAEAAMLPHARPVAHRWTLAPLEEWKLRLYRGSATPLIAAAALPARLGSGVFDTRHMALGLSIVIAVALLLVAHRLAGPKRALAATAGAAVSLPVVLAAHNAALLGSFYSEIAFVLGLPFVVLALLMRPGRTAHVLLFGATAMAAMAKAPFFYLPTLVAAGLWWFERRQMRAAESEKAPRRGAWLALGFAQLLALVVVARGEFAAMNAHHATFLGSDYRLNADQLVKAGLPREFHDCVGVDFWGNRVATPDAVVIEPAPVACRTLPERRMTQALGTWIRNPDHFLLLAWSSLPLHARADYFHLSLSTRYRHRVNDSLATRLLDMMSAARDVPLRGLGFPGFAFALLVVAVMPTGRHLRIARPVIAILAAFAISQVVVSLVGEGVRDLGKHLAAGQFSVDMALALVLMLAVTAWAKRIGRITATDPN